MSMKSIEENEKRSEKKECYRLLEVKKEKLKNFSKSQIYLKN